MKRKIVALGASNSRQSINKKFADYVAHQVPDAEVNLLDLNDYEMPIYGIDREREQGIPSLAYEFKRQLLEADGIVISFAEHNGAYTVAFKNIMDWISRLEGSVWGDKPMFLLAAAPGKRGGRTVLDIAVNKFKYMNKNTLVDFCLPYFSDSFSEEEGIRNPELQQQFKEQLALFHEALPKEVELI